MITFSDPRIPLDLRVKLANAVLDAAAASLNMQVVASTTSVQDDIDYATELANQTAQRAVELQNEACRAICSN